jgi:Glycine zipper
MKRRMALFIVTAFACGSYALAQAPPAQPTGQKTLAATMNVYAFPTTGQTPEQQSQDEAACYTYANQQTGTDPFALQKQAQAQAQQTEAAKQQAAQAGAGAGAKGAVKGAAAGAVVGEIASDDAGEGAAVGAAAGVVAGRRKAKAAQKQATAQAEQQGQQAQQATAEQLTNFKKAFGVCLEAKKYMVKY